ncbi:MAG: helix-turn-helix transcriptional regulator [Phascolarctobacterium sp.]|nr:helix-turn-helix transcriptional regulator [Candidatus Phascolarctobacterium caballi]
MFEEDFQKRLYELRTQKGISARDMSLSIGQNPNYINFIEAGKAMPSMSAFFFICDYLKITPSEFFETKSHNPEKMRNIIKDLQSLSQKNFDNIAEIINALTKI